MIYIENPYTDPGLNLAIEETIFSSGADNDSVLILWRNNNAVIVGRYQNTYEQINAAAVEELGVSVVRRNTGGGAVYHDLGNLNYTFITSTDNLAQVDFKNFALPVVRALHKLGAKVELSGRNDILLEGRKISGTAQTCVGNKVLFHGTLLFDSNLGLVERLLKVSDAKLKSKGIPSIRSRVTNIRPFLDAECDISEFSRLILKCIGDEQSLSKRVLSPGEIGASQLLGRSKYETWAWNYGESPPANYRSECKLSCGNLSLNLQLENGLIMSCVFFGDFLGLGDLGPLERALGGIPYNHSAVAEIIDAFDLNHLFGGLSSSELLPLFFSPDEQPLKQEQYTHE